MSTTAERQATLADLSLGDLRILRSELTDEEGRVSYWRRLFQARLDVMLDGGEIDTTALCTVLQDATRAPHRWQVLGLHPNDMQRSFPEAQRLWERIVDPNNPSERHEYVEMLKVVEQSLSATRRVLHERIDEVTHELIRRYKANPALALTALPHR